MRTIPYELSLQEIGREDPELLREMLQTALADLWQGRLDEGRGLLRDYVRATIGFAELGRRLGRDPKNLMRALTAGTNPTIGTLAPIVEACLDYSGFEVETRVSPRKTLQEA